MSRNGMLRLRSCLASSSIRIGRVAGVELLGQHHSSVVSSAAATPATAPSVAPIIGIRSHSATTNASVTANGTPSAVKTTKAASPAAREISRLPIM